MEAEAQAQTSAQAQVQTENLSAKRRRIMDVDKDLQDLRKARLAAVAAQLGHELHVFVSTAARNWNGPSISSDEPDDFYEFTAEDYFRLTTTKKEDNVLKTRKQRDAEQALRREKITKAVIRVQFPDNYIIEATFQPSETISTLIDFLKKVVAKPDVPFYIYTTPPKRRITDLTTDFYSANLVPCALVRFNYDVPAEDNGPFLRDDIAALCDLHLLVGQKEEVKSDEPTSLAMEPPAQVLDNKPAVKKVVKPKWMRM